MQQIIKVNQVIKQVTGRDFSAHLTINDGESIEEKEFQYVKANGIYPAYHSLLFVINKNENAHIELTTNNRIFAEEITGLPNINARLLELYQTAIKNKNVTIDVDVK